MASVYRVTELARLARVTVRTLHHYDQIGLLTPSGRSSAGHRLYESSDVLRLQQILLHRALGLPLESIRLLLDDPSFDLRAALERQRVELKQRQDELAQMIHGVDAALAQLETPNDGGNTMDSSDLFEGFDPEQYATEVQRRWGDSDAYVESAKRTKRYGADDWAAIKAEADAIYRGFAASLADGMKPGDGAALELVERHRQHIDRWFYPCSRAMHFQVSRMYDSDPRFKANLDKYGSGVAAFMADAIEQQLSED